MSKEKFYKKVTQYRFEFLLAALVLLLFDKIFVIDNSIFIKYVWPINMILLSVASLGLVLERQNNLYFKIRLLLAALSIFLPILYGLLKSNYNFMLFLLLFFFIYYSILFIETLSQIVKKEEVTISVILGSISGYLLLVLISSFSFIIIEYLLPHSFSNLTYLNPSLVYNQLIYYSFILITSTGFGDILPISDAARLTSSFFGVLSQFYMVALVGIIVSKFTTK